MDWFDQLRAALAAYYPAGTGPTIVGYLQGAKSPKIWRSMGQSRAEQMLILGSVPPTDEEWIAAGVRQRGNVQTIYYEDLRGFLVTYGGFVMRPWGKITVLSAELYRNYGNTTIPQFQRNMPKAAAAASQRASFVNEMTTFLDKMERSANLAFGDHQTQGGLLSGSQGHFSGFWGYWTNHLFNSDIPPQSIWDAVYNEIEHSRSTLKEGKLPEAWQSAHNARKAYVEAYAIYYRWKDGIEGAGGKMQVGIAAVAVLVVLAAASATVVGAGAAVAPPTVAGAETAAATVTRVSALIAHADSLAVRIATTSPGGLTAPSAAAYEQALAEAAEATVEMLKMVR